MQPEAIAHLGTGSQCAAEGDVITIDADRLDRSLCGDCGASDGRSWSAKPGQTLSV